MKKSNINKCVQALVDSYTHPAEGDRCVMFAALYNRLLNADLIQDRTKRPSRTRVIHKILETEFDIKGLPKWGATAVRGDLMDNKEHIRLFIDSVNSLMPNEIEEAWKACCLEYKKRMDLFFVPMETNSEETLSTILRGLIDKKSGGRIQQPLCFATTKVLYSSLGAEYSVNSKRVFAGDLQSKSKGDINILKNGTIVCVLEVKAHKIDSAKVLEVLYDHGKHSYELLILGSSFSKDVMFRENLTFCTIFDYIFTTATHIASIKACSLEQILKEILIEYNTIMINIEGRKDLSVKLNLK